MFANLMSGPACINIGSFTVDFNSTHDKSSMCTKSTLQHQFGRLINNVKPDQLEQPDMDTLLAIPLPHFTHLG